VKLNHLLFSLQDFWHTVLEGERITAMDFSPTGGLLAITFWGGNLHLLAFSEGVSSNLTFKKRQKRN
jgi:hypothetical protein